MSYYNHHPADRIDYVDYYRNQAGGGLPGYAGGSVMYGAGLGGLFRGLFRMAIPLLKKGFSIAKPHLKSAAKNIVSDVVTTAMSRGYTGNDRNQDGSGLMVMARKRMTKPPGVRRRGHSIKKTKSGQKKRSVVQRKRKKSVNRRKCAKRSVKTIF